MRIGDYCTYTNASAHHLTKKQKTKSSSCSTNNTNSNSSGCNEETHENHKRNETCASNSSQLLQLLPEHENGSEMLAAARLQ